MCFYQKDCMKIVCLISLFFFCSACFGAYWNEWNCMDYEPLDNEDHKDDDNHHDITTII